MSIEIEEMKKSISDMLRRVSNIKSKEECMEIILLTTYEHTVEMSDNKSIPIESKLWLSFLMGLPVSLIQTIVDDKGMLDEAFSTALANNMHEYYTAYIKDLEHNMNKKEEIKD